MDSRETSRHRAQMSGSRCASSRRVASASGLTRTLRSSDPWQGRPPWGGEDEESAQLADDAADHSGMRADPSQARRQPQVVARALPSHRPALLRLLIDDRDRISAQLLRVCRERVNVTCAEDDGMALALVERAAVDGIICVPSLVAGRTDAGYEILLQASRRSPGLPVAMLVDKCERRAVNRVAALGGVLLCSPVSARHLVPFLDRVVAGAASRERLAHTALAFARKWQLAPRERELMLHLVAGHDPGGICERAGYGRATYKTYVKRLLARSGCLRTSDVALVVLRATAATAPRLR